MPESPKAGKAVGSKARRFKRVGFDRRVVVLRDGLMSTDERAEAFIARLGITHEPVKPVTL